MAVSFHLVRRMEDLQFPKLLPTLSIFVDPHTKTNTRARKDPKSIIANLDLTLLPPKDIRPDLTSVHLTNPHPFLPWSGVRQDDRTTPPLIPRAESYPPDTRCIVKVVLLLSISVEFARENEIREGATAGWRERLCGAFGVDAVHVTVEKTWVSGVAEQNEGVGERLEEAFNRRFESLVGLRVVVHHESLEISATDQQVREGEK